MVGKRYYGIFIFAICAVIFVVSGDRIWAGKSETVKKYDRQISDARQEGREYAEKSEELQKEIEEIEADKEKTLAYIEKLDKKGVALEEELDRLERDIRETGDELDAAGAELEAAEQTQERQYATMKKRIKYMYENGNQDYLEILFSAKSIGELLNRTEYIEKIADYDRNIFEEYKRTKAAVEQKQQEIAEKLIKLGKMQEKQTAEKEALSALKKKKKNELETYNEKLEVSQDKVDEYARQAAEAEAEVEKLLQERQDAIDRENAVGSGNSGGGDGTLRWPLGVSGRISSGFGYRSSPTAGASTYHKGIDIAVSSGTPILAAAEGEVVTASYSASAGNYVMVSHGNRLYTVYMHCSRLAVKVGDAVVKGQVIAYVGSTGISTGAHLHFGVSKNGAYVDPMGYVS